MSFKQMLSIIMLGVSCTVYGMQEDKSPARDLAENVVIGTLSGITEVSVHSPLIYFKNTLQRGEKITWTNPKTWFRGFRMNVAAMGPTTAFQIGGDAGLEAVVPGTDIASKVARAFAAGMLSAAVNAPVETVIIDQQKNNSSVSETIKRLYKEAGSRVIVRGWLPTAIREGAFTTGYLVAFPATEKAIKSHVDNGLIAYVGAGAATGAVVATVTHPVDTIKTWMQVDYQGKKYPRMKDAVRAIYRENGVAGFFSGVAPRAIRASLAIPMIGKLKEVLSEHFASDKN